MQHRAEEEDIKFRASLSLCTRGYENRVDSFDKHLDVEARVGLVGVVIMSNWKHADGRQATSRHVVQFYG